MRTIALPLRHFTQSRFCMGAYLLRRLPLLIFDSESDILSGERQVPRYFGGPPARTGLTCVNERPGIEHSCYYATEKAFGIRKTGLPAGPGSRSHSARARLNVRRCVYIRSETRDPDPVDGSGRDEPDVDSRS